MKGNTLKITFFLANLNDGGAERVILNLAHGFAKRRYSVDLVVGNTSGPYLKQVSSNVRLIDLKASRVRYCIKNLVRYFKYEKPDVILSAIGHANNAAVLACKLARVRTKVFVSVHTSMYQGSKTKKPFTKRQLMRALTKWLYTNADGVIAVSEGVANNFSAATKMSRDKIHTIYNPVINRDLYNKAAEPVEHEWFLNNQIPVILAVGRLNKVKDYPTLLKSFALIRNKCFAKLAILGEGPERPELMRLSNSLGIEEDVWMPGFMQNPYPYMRKSSVLVLSSVREGLPTVLVEALALGTRVVSTDCHSGPREILRGGELGTLVPVGDIESLAEGVFNAMQPSPPEGNLFKFRKFTVSAAVNHYKRVFERA